MSFSLPADVQVSPPSLPSVEMAPPGPPSTVLVPVAGPRGIQGPAGDETGLGFVWTQSSPAQLLLIHHHFLFQPAGILCIESDGGVLEYDTVFYPQTGYIELTFGVPFVGTVYLS